MLSGFRWAILVALLCTIPTQANASLTDAETGSVLYFSCDSDDLCQLTPIPIGEEIVTGSVQANPLFTESVAIEFDMFPEQTELAVLPAPRPFHSFPATGLSQLLGNLSSFPLLSVL